ncbi:hypothetical protein BTO06_09280 [Tenacibaculum sp. SZ-18]|uniref:hypothetical protein n=1 Tax=Tenacibaculum sp. SZ-18 TaxID=754423 RepID=UPI000C2D34D3|nr:hypothetical protein [Tenacibaculum sp. SZ-18]AUC15321.1 hypothetical protein BTO06_09280 [Tenacibaculum sp. SZ-18]
MKIEHKEGYVLISSEEFSFSEFFTFFSNQHKDLTKNNVIINISSNLVANEEEISLFLEYADIHRKNGTSFIVVYQNVDMDKFPEIFNIVPTLQEAEDVLEMENIQRDLGF